MSGGKKQCNCNMWAAHVVLAKTLFHMYTVVERAEGGDEPLAQLAAMCMPDDVGQVTLGVKDGDSAKMLCDTATTMLLMHLKIEPLLAFVSVSKANREAGELGLDFVMTPDALMAYLDYMHSFVADIECCDRPDPAVILSQMRERGYTVPRVTDGLPEQVCLRSGMAASVN